MALTRGQVRAFAAAVIVTVAGIASYDIVSSHHTVSVEADGKTFVVSGFHANVEEILTAGGVHLGAHDRVEPAPAEPLVGVETVRVLRAKPIALHSQGSVATEWSTDDSLDTAHLSLLEAGRAADSIGVSRSTVRSELPLTGEARTVQVVVDGETTLVRANAGEDVSQILRRADVTVTGMDSVFVVPAGEELTVQVITETRAVVNRVDEIPFETDRREDPDLLEGTERVLEEGSSGELTTRLYERIVGGETVFSATVSEKVTAQPKPRVIAVGTKKPVRVVEETSAPSTGTDVSDVQVSNGDVWAALAQCESGGNPAANTGNGYYGMYQFSLPTWQSVGGAGLPSDASAAEQTQRAQVLQQRSGWGQWPACSARLGLR